MKNDELLGRRIKHLSTGMVLLVTAENSKTLTCKVKDFANAPQYVRVTTRHKVGRAAIGVLYELMPVSDRETRNPNQHPEPEIC